VNEVYGGIAAEIKKRQNYENKTGIADFLPPASLINKIKQKFLCLVRKKIM
jgi:hypothetical protein